MNRWLNYDLHMHSHFSKPVDNNKVKEMTAKEYCDAIMAKHTDVFSITDHNCFSSSYYGDIKEYIKDKELKVIPGCELNVYVDEEHYFHMNVYFDTDSRFKDIEDTIISIYRDELKPKFSYIISKLFSLNLRFLVFPEADKSRGLSQVWRSLTKIGLDSVFQFYGMYRIFSAYDSTATFNETSADSWALSYYKNTVEFRKITDGLNDTQITTLTGEVNNLIKGEVGPFSELSKKVYSIIREYGSYFTYFRFSDWHNSNEYNPSYSNYIYGNIEEYFGTLELAVIDPMSRIVIKPYGEKITIPESFIKSISFTIDKKPVEVSFGPGLNAIVGKRASGKSLLVAVISLLSDKNSIKLNNYAKLKVNRESITCKTQDGRDINLGELGSISFIEQNEIAKIFNSPSSFSETLKMKFKKPIDVDWSKLYEIKGILSSIKPYDNNYKSISPILGMNKKYSYYSFSSIKQIDKSNFISSYLKLDKALNDYISSIETFGFNTSYLGNIKNLFSKKHIELSFKVTTYEDLITKTNAEINNLNSKYYESDSAEKQKRNDIDTFHNTVITNFETLLLFKKLVYLIANIDVPIPPPNIYLEGKFIYASGYKKDTDSISESLQEVISSSINKTKFRNTECIKLIEHYLCSETTLNTDNLSSKIDDKFMSSLIVADEILYENIGGVDSVTLYNSDMNKLEELCRENKIENITSSSLGRKTSAYLEIMLDVPSSILVFDQPEDNIDNDYISNVLVPLLKTKKKNKQLIFVTHNPSVAVYTDAFNYIYAKNEDNITYESFSIESLKDKEEILSILDGGRISFSNRNNKYGMIRGEFRYDFKD